MSLNAATEGPHSSATVGSSRQAKTTPTCSGHEHWMPRRTVTPQTTATMSLDPTAAAQSIWEVIEIVISRSPMRSKGTPIISACGPCENDSTGSGPALRSECHSSRIS